MRASAIHSMSTSMRARQRCKQGRLRSASRICALSALRHCQTGEAHRFLSLAQRFLVSVSRKLLTFVSQESPNRPGSGAAPYCTTSPSIWSYANRDRWRPQSSFVGQVFRLRVCWIPGAECNSVLCPRADDLLRCRQKTLSVLFAEDRMGIPSRKCRDTTVQARPHLSESMQKKT